MYFKSKTILDTYIETDSRKKNGVQGAVYLINLVQPVTPNRWSQLGKTLHTNATLRDDSMMHTRLIMCFKFLEEGCNRLGGKTFLSRSWEHGPTETNWDANPPSYFCHRNFELLKGHMTTIPGRSPDTFLIVRHHPARTSKRFLLFEFRVHQRKSPYGSLRD